MANLLCGPVSCWPFPRSGLNFCCKTCRISSKGKDQHPHLDLIPSLVVFMWAVEGLEQKRGGNAFGVCKVISNSDFSTMTAGHLKKRLIKASIPRSEKFVSVLTDSACWSEWVVVWAREYSRKLSDRLSLSYNNSSTSSSARSPSLGLRAYWKPVGLVDSALSRGGRERERISTRPGLNLHSLVLISFFKLHF